MRSATVLPVVGLLLSCTPATSSQAPEPTEAPEPAADPSATEEAQPSTDPEAAEADADKDDADVEAHADADATTDGTPDADAPGPTTVTSRPPDPVGETAPETSGGTASATLELPKAIHGELNEKCGRDPGVGSPLKSFDLPSTSGKNIRNATYRGRVLLVNFWGTWCKPCLQELPEFAQLYRRYRKFGMTLLAIATDDDPKAVDDILAKKKIAAKVAIGGEDYAGQYGSPKFPFTFVVDHKGIIRASYRGYRPECMGQLEADLREQMQVRADAKARRKAR